MASWLGSVVSDKLRDALVWKTAKHDRIKPEPGLDLVVTEDGSNLKVKLNHMPSVLLHVLKVQGQMLTLTDGTVSLQARVSPLGNTRFQNQYSCPLASLKTKSITCIISEITATHMGPPVSRVQLVLSTLTVSATPLDPSDIDISSLIPINKVVAIHESLQQLQQFHQPAVVEPTASVTTVPTSVLVETTDADMTEAPSDSPKPAERMTPLKRPHSVSPPRQSSSHRSVRPRIHHEDEDVIVQTGLNLHQPIQLSTNDSRQGERLLNVIRKGSDARTSASTIMEQALLLGNRMSAQMAPPPTPVAKNNSLEAQPPLQPDSQNPSQSFQSQIPLAEVPSLEPARDTVPGDKSSKQPQPEVIALNTQPTINLPNNTPTSAQPEPLEVTQSSLPQKPLPSKSSTPRKPLPSQSEALAASLSTSSSHLLSNPSSSIPRPIYRAPPALFIKYARRPRPKNQEKLLAKPSSWWPPKPGTTFPHPNIPVEVLNKIEERAERRAAKKKEEEQRMQREQEIEREQNRLAKDSPATQGTQGTQDSVLPWESSPPEHRNPPQHRTPPRMRKDALRLSTNFGSPLPPDSSAEDHMQAENHMQVDPPADQIPSSPPSGSPSQYSDGLEIDDFASPLPSPRQLPEYPLGSPEESSSRPNPGSRPHNSELRREQDLHEITSQVESRPDRDDQAPSPIPEVAASPQPREGTEDEPATNLQPLKDGTPQSLDRFPVPLATNDVTTTNDRPHVDDGYDDDDVVVVVVVVDDQSQAEKDTAVDDPSQIEVTESPNPQPRRRRRHSWGLEESTETIEQRHARIKREFIEKRKGTPLQDTDTTLVAQAESQSREMSEVPASNRQTPPDPMEVDVPPVESTQSFESGAAKRASIIDQWRQRSGQKDYRSEPGVSNTEPSEPVELKPSVSNPAASKTLLPEPIVPAGTAKSGETTQSTENSSFSEPSKLRSTNKAEKSLVSTSITNTPTNQLQDVRSQHRTASYRTRFGEPTRALWVGSLPADIDNKRLWQMFAEFDPVFVSAQNKSGFVNFADIDTAYRALQAKHESVLDGRMVVCNFATPRGRFAIDEPASHHNSPNPSRPTVPTPIASGRADKPQQNATTHAPPSLSIDDLYRQLVQKRNYKGNKKAFETLCKDLHTSSDIPPVQWDNYVVLQPADYMPWANRTIANGGKVPDYDTYWHERLQNTVEPDLFPILTPPKLDAVFNKTPQTVVQSLSSRRSSASVSPQTTPGASRPPRSSAQRTPSPSSSLTPRPASVAENLRRSVVERNAQFTTSTPQNVAPKPHPLLNTLEPLRTSEWLDQTFLKDPEASELQSDLYKMYKDAFSRGTIPLLPGKEFIDAVFEAFPGHTTSQVDDKGNRLFYCKGLRRKATRPTSAKSGMSTPEHKIKGISASSSSGNRDSDEYFRPSSHNAGRRESHLGYRERALGSRRSLPFEHRSRSRSPPRNPPSTRIPKGLRRKF